MARFEMGGLDIASMAERQPSGEGLFELGLVYATGREVETDLVAAHKWFNLAAMRGSREAARYRQEIALEMSSDAVAEAQRAAREWLRSQH
jgi:TPR repeat protein